MSYLSDLERAIDSKMKKIANKTITPKESNIGGLFNSLKGVDEVSYDMRIEKYKKILKEL